MAKIIVLSVSPVFSQQQFPPTTKIRDKSCFGKLPYLTVFASLPYINMISREIIDRFLPDLMSISFEQNNQRPMGHNVYLSGQL